jgi:general secretion pathway protein I
MTVRPPRRPGLSLTEVLLALTILIIALAAINRLTDVGTASGRDAQFTSRGTRLAQSKMAEIESGALWPADSQSGSFDGDDGGWTYSVTASEDGTAPNLFLVTVTVKRDSGRPFEVVLSQLIFDPTKTGSAAQAERPPPPDAADTSGMGGTAP